MSADNPSKSFMPGKFSSDIVWNMGSFGVLALSGFLLNIIIGRVYGSEALGIFNLVFAIYIFVSQLTVFGLHFSVLRNVARCMHDPAERDAVISSGIVTACVLATVMTFVAYLATGPIGRLMNSSGVARGWLYVLPGLWCFAQNKVLLAVVNGLMHMRTFAVLQAARYLLMILALAVCVSCRVDGDILSVIISLAEVVLFVLLIVITSRYYHFARPGSWNGWAGRHIRFGLKSFMSGTLVELNSRVDVIMLGMFVSDKMVGIYSMAALVMEGVEQIAMVVRNVINPMLARDLGSDNPNGVLHLRSVVMRFGYPVMLLACGTAVLVYPLFIRLVVGNQDFMEGYSVLMILMAGLFLCSGYLPFNMILLQAGFPGFHTAYMGMIVAVNIIANSILIPLSGMNGAASATALAFVMSVVFLKIFSRRLIGLRI